MKNNTFTFRTFLFLFILIGLSTSVIGQIHVSSKPKGSTGGEICSNPNGQILNVYATVGKHYDVHLASISVGGQNVPIGISKTLRSSDNNEYEYEFRMTFPQPLSNYNSFGGKLIGQLTFEWSYADWHSGQVQTQETFNLCSIGWDNPYSNSRVTGSADQFEKEISIYPNPISKYLDIKLKLEKEQLLSIHIIGMDGKLYNTWDFRDQDVSNRIFEDRYDLNGLSNGTYLIRIQTSRSVISKKFTKQ